MDNNFNTNEPYVAEVKCPGKEITGLVLGINSLVWGILGAIMGCIPFYGIIYAVIWGAFGIATGIVAMNLHKQVHEQATVITNRIETGKKLGKAGLIVSICGIALSIIITIFVVVFVGAAAYLGAVSSN